MTSREEIINKLLELIDREINKGEFQRNNQKIETYSRCIGAIENNIKMENEQKTNS